MAEPSDANKRQKPEDAVPAFSDTISNFAVEETLRFEAGGRLAVVLGKLDGRDCVLELKQRAALADPRALEDALPKLKLTLTNHSGAEYSYYAATDPTTGATYDLEAVWPAPERLVQRKRPAEICVVEETAEAYDRVVRPFAEAQAARIGWIDAVCALEKERERNLHACDAFVVNVDTKWSTHGPFDDDRATWRGADWTRDLYLLAISKDASLKSMRDLRGPDGAGLCRAMRAALLRCAADVYGAVSYQELVREALGPAAAHAVSVALIAYIAGSCVAYTIIVADAFDSVAAATRGSASPPHRAVTPGVARAASAYAAT